MGRCTARGRFVPPISRSRDALPWTLGTLFDRRRAVLRLRAHRNTLSVHRAPRRLDFQPQNDPGLWRFQETGFGMAVRLHGSQDREWSRHVARFVIVALAVRQFTQKHARLFAVREPS